MITFPNAKINLGLNVLSKREDGYHNIESLFYPIPLEDALEILPTGGDFEFSSTGIALDCVLEDNIVVKAYRLLKEDFLLPNVKIHLHKNIPFGAGLGGGSADAAFTLKMLNAMFELQLSNETLIKYAAKIGADCAFFIENKPVIAEGIGDVLSPFELDMKGHYLLLIKPDVAVPTPKAYKYVIPEIPEISLRDSLRKPLRDWNFEVKNDFEKSVFQQYPSLSNLKRELYNMGALYASMSGSGSSIFGIFEEKPTDNPIFVEHFCFETVL